MTLSVVCVDASVALKLVLPEEGHDEVVERWRAWAESGTRIVSPHLFAYETTSALRNKVVRGRIGADAAREARAGLRLAQVELLHPEGLEDEAYVLATRLGRPAAYDSFYLALGKALGCATWTADARLFRSVHREVPWLKQLGSSGDE